MNFDDLFPPHEDSSGGTYTTGRSEQESNHNMGSVIILCLLMVVSIILAGLFGGYAGKENRSKQEKEPPAFDSSVQNNETVHIPDSRDFIVHYTFGGKDYCGFLFQPNKTKNLPNGYILTSSEIFSDNTLSSITISTGDGQRYTAYFREKNDTLGVAILLIHGDNLPEGAALSGLNSSPGGNPEKAFLYLDGAPDAELSFQYEELLGKNTFISKTFLKLDSLPEHSKPGSPIFNDAGQVIAIMANPEKIADGLDAASDYAASIADVNDWVWDALQNPLRYIGIHGKIISSPDKTEQSLNSGFCVDYVEATKNYDLSDCIASGDLILGFFDNYSLTRPNDLSDTEALNLLYNNFTGGKLVALSVYRSENETRTKPVFLRHNTKQKKSPDESIAFIGHVVYWISRALRLRGWRRRA